MIKCPNCRHQNITGSAFCIECGVMLLPSDKLTTQRMAPLRHAAAVGARSSTGMNPAPSRDHWATLHLLESGDVLPLASRNEFTLGRASDGQPIMPDIDLAPYQAFSHGVSRLHAVIKRGVEDIVLRDLDSANGTFVNGRRLEPNEEQVVAHGDTVALGSLRMQILLKSM